MRVDGNSIIASSHILRTLWSYIMSEVHNLFEGQRQNYELNFRKSSSKNWKQNLFN